MLPRELAEVRKMVERQQPGRQDAGSVPDIAVAQGPLESVAAVHELDEQCQDPATCQFLVCCALFSG